MLNNWFKNTKLLQINSQTAFLDLSILYGIDNDGMMKQRSRRGGKLRVQNDQSTGNQEVPAIFPAKQCKMGLGGVDRGPRGQCFMSGKYFG